MIEFIILINTAIAAIFAIKSWEVLDEILKATKETKDT